MTGVQTCALPICELGEALERLGRTDEARRAYELLLDQRLPAGEAIARARLEQLGGGARR